MSRKQKNIEILPKNDNSVNSRSKIVRIDTGEDYHKAKTLEQWLFMKYEITYKAYRNKSKNRRNELRAEFEADTGIDLKEREKERNMNHLNNRDYEYSMNYLASIGIPFAPDGTPLGIGWDD